MALPLSSLLEIYKSADGKTDILCVLYDIEIIPGTTLRLVEGDPTGTGSLVYGGNTYLASAITRSEITQNIEGELPSLNVAISNVDGQAAGYIEQYDLDGKAVTITRVLLSTLSSADALSESYKIHEHTYDRRQATFRLGTTNLFKRRMPQKQFVRHKCQHIYEQRFQEDNGCFYPSDIFGPDTRQNFKIGATTDGEQKRQHGWHTFNALKVSIWDTDTSVPDAAIISSQSLDIDWVAAVHAAPFMFKKVSGDFDCWAEVEPTEYKAGARCGILCYEASGDQNSWVYLVREWSTAEEFIVLVASAEDAIGALPTALEEENAPFLRLKRVGNLFTSYWSLDGIAWSQIEQRTVQLDSDVRLGLAISAPSTETGSVSTVFRQFRFLSGGLATCDRTPEDCSNHENIIHFLGFLGIPRT